MQNASSRKSSFLNNENLTFRNDANKADQKYLKFC